MSDENYMEIEKVKVGHPKPNCANWQYNVRPAEALDAAGVEIVAYPIECEERDIERGTPRVPEPVQWLIKKIFQ